MGWIAFYKDGKVEREDEGLVGRPMAAGESGDLRCIAQEDFGHKVAVDLVNGVVVLEYGTIGVQNGTIEITAKEETSVNDTVDDTGKNIRVTLTKIIPPLFFWVCEETNIAGELKHRETKLNPKRDEKGKILRDENKKQIMVKTDYETPLLWRPIWFTRFTNGVPTKVIGLQTTLPEGFGGKNVKKLISIFADGRLGID